MSDKKTSTRRPSIKAVSKPNAEKGIEALRKCGCFPEVDKRLRTGSSTPEIASMIQDEYGELTHLSHKYVQQLIKAHRSSLPPTELALTTSDSRVAKTARKKLAEGLNELEEMEKLFKIQIERINIDFGNERKIKKLFPTTGREVYVAVKILKQSADLKSDLGIYQKQLGTVEITGKAAIAIADRTGNDSIGGIVRDADSRRKVLSMVTRLMTLGGDTIDAVFSEEASTKIIDIDESLAPSDGE